MLEFYRSEIVRHVIYLLSFKAFCELRISHPYLDEAITLDLIESDVLIADHKFRIRISLHYHQFGC